MKYLDYAKHVGGDEHVLIWVENTLSKYLDKNSPSTEEVEHIIDYLGRTSKNISYMSYPDAKKNADKWTKTLQKKGMDIKEKKVDTKTVLDFKDGFKIVQLIGENAYKREGFLMRSCVSSYYGKDVKVYSLRDKNNNPHCTMEHDQQIKGKGNGDIHPKYVDYVVKFLEYTGMTVGDSEMEHLGYINIEKCDDKRAVFQDLYKNKYFRKDNVGEIVDKHGKKYQSLSLWGLFGLFNFTLSGKVKFNFSITESVETFNALFKPKTATKIQSGGNHAKISGGDHAQISGGYHAKMSGGYNTKMIGGYNTNMIGGYHANMIGGNNANISGGNHASISGGDDANISGGNHAKISGGNHAKMIGGNYAKMIGGNHAKMIGGNHAKMIGGNHAQISGGDYSQMSGGDYSQMSGGYSAKMSSGDYSKISGGNHAKMIGGNNAKIELNGINALAIAGKDSQMKGVKGAWIVLAEYNKEHNIIAIESTKIDGKEIKENVWYKLADRKFVEVT